MHHAADGKEGHSAEPNAQSEPRSRTHILIVGTSLINNLMSLERGQGCELTDVNNASARVVDKFNQCGRLSCLCAPSPSEDLYKVWAPLVSLDPCVQLGKRQNSSPQRPDLLPQEISYLLLHARTPVAGCSAPSPCRPDRVALIASDSPEGKLCAYLIAVAISEGSKGPKRLGGACSGARGSGSPTSSPLLSKLTMYTIEPSDVRVARGLNVMKPSEFQSEGIASLHTHLRDLICEARERKHLICIDVTGGFKAVVPYTVLYSMLDRGEDLRLVYLFESSNQILELPPYPLGVDFTTWHEERSILDLALRMPDGCARNRVAGRLSRRMRSVFDVAVTPTGTVGPSPPLGEALRSNYREQVERGHLSVYAAAVARRLFSLVDTVKVPHQDRILEFIKRTGDYIWTGDKIPEMVEHSHRHHLHVLEFAECLLTPILTLKPDFLSPADLSVLVGAILLHDCGHTLREVRLSDGSKQRLFPDEIRQVHQYLAYQRLTTPCLYQQLGFDDGDKQWLECVALAALYHRRQMPFGCCEAPVRVPFEENAFVPPLTLLTASNQCKSSWWQRLQNACPMLKCNKVNLPLVVAILRICDGCDAASATRAGPAEQIRLHKALALHEAEIEDQVASELESAMQAHIARTGLPDICTHCDASSWWAHRRKVWARLQNCAVSDDEKHLWILWTNWAEAKSRAEFLRAQIEHFTKHSLVSGVTITPADNFQHNQFSFVVELTFDYNTFEGLKVCSGLLDGKTADQWKRQILDEVKREYDSVEKALKSKQVEIVYRWAP